MVNNTAVAAGPIRLRGIDLSGYMCRDAARAMAFYRDVFGLEPARQRGEYGHLTPTKTVNELQRVPAVAGAAGLPADAVRRTRRAALRHHSPDDRTVDEAVHS